MSNALQTASAPTDSPEARRYNRIRRWLGIADFLLGLFLLLVLLATGWNGTLRDIAMHGAYEHYAVAVFLYVLMLMLIGKLLGLASTSTVFDWNAATICPIKSCARGFGTKPKDF